LETAKISTFKVISSTSSNTQKKLTFDSVHQIYVSTIQLFYTHQHKYTCILYIKRKISWV